MDHKSKLRQIALAALFAMGAVQGVNAQALQDSGASAGVVSQPGTTTALPANSQAPQVQTGALTTDEAKQSAAGNVAVAGKDAGADWPNFNGVRRDNKSSETGLLPSWPSGGPKPRRERPRKPPRRRRAPRANSWRT